MLVHCAGGTGRTGMVIASIVKSVGVRNPIQWIRRVKSTYVETKEQEDFVNNLPAVLDAKITTKYPTLASVIALGILQLAIQQHQAQHGELADSSNQKALPTSVEEIGLSFDQVHDYSAAFDLYDKDGGGSISADELKDILKSIGATDSTEDIINKYDPLLPFNFPFFEIFLVN